ncbi:MAG: protease modulator HflK, partial [Verrucomicrobia bacterium]|nr:protease modulator HflK [Verrucomicrobiota bacterium]
GQAGVCFLSLGFLIAAISYFQMRLEARERLEKLEYDELKKAAGSAALFTEQAETFPARRAREQFERYFVPGFTVLLFLAQVGAVYWLWRTFGQLTPPPAGRASAGFIPAIFALILFLLGKYSAGVARYEHRPLLRPGAAYLLLAALICLLNAVSEAAVWLGYPQVDLYVGRLLAVVLGLVAVETLVNLILEIYRPRVQGQAERMLYESRLIGLLSQPGGLITTAAQALDYQFGFKVSETWFYRFLEQALAWLILLQLGVLLLSTTIVIIEPQEQALLECFGSPVANRPVLGPGLHFKWPWPIEKVYRYRTREIQQFTVGSIEDPEREQERAVLWTRPHSKEEFNMLVASRENAGVVSPSSLSGEQAVPVNLLAVSIPVQYRINNLTHWAYGHANPAPLLQDLATREVVDYLVSVDIDDLMANGRLQAGRDLQARIQQRADESKLGVKIVLVGLEDIHPPVKVASAYEQVSAAAQERETKILDAQADWAQKIPQAYADATSRVDQAESDRLQKAMTAEARAGRFPKQLRAYEAAPSVFMERSYLETLARAVAPARKYVLATTNAVQVFQIDLQDKLRPDLLEVPLSTSKK